MTINKSKISYIGANKPMFPQCSPVYTTQLDIINSVSKKVASDAYLVVRRSLGFENGWASSEQVTVKHLKVFTANLTKLVGQLGDDASRLISQGFQALFSDRDYWMKIEKCAETIFPRETSERSKAVSELSEAILYLVKSCKNNADLISPSSIRLPNREKARAYTLAPLYHVSTELVLECQSLLMRYVMASSKPELAIVKARGAVSGLVMAAKDNVIKDGLRKQGLRFIASDADKCLTSLSACATRSDRRALLVLLRECDPTILGPNRKDIPTTVKSIPVEYAGIRRNLKAVHFISPTMAQQAQDYLRSVSEECGKSQVGNSPKEIVSNFPILGRWIYQLQDQLDTGDRQLIYHKGALAFLENKGKLLRWLYEMSQSLKNRNTDMEKKLSIRSTLAGSSLQKSYIALTGVLSFLTGHRIKVERYYPYYLEFPHEGDPHDFRYFSIQYIYENYPALSQDLIKAKKKLLGSMKHDARADVSVYSFFRVLKPIFEFCDEVFTEQERKSLAKEGARALSSNQHRIMKKCLEQIQQRFKSGEIASETAHNYQRTLKEFTAMNGLTWVDSFPIDAGRARLVNKQKNTDDYYTLDEAAQLAYHIEHLLAKENLPRLHQLWLRVARIVLKTNWNLSPVLNLDVDDLFEVEFAGKRTYLVRLFKPRALYATQWNHFDAHVEELLVDDIKVGKEVVAVVRDLQFIMNNLSADIRFSLSDTHPFKKSLMIFNDGLHSNGRAKRLTEGSFKKGINELLSESNCPIVFTPTKIRKGGLNFIYRQVSKELRKYNAVSNHTWEVFKKNYFRYDEKASEEALSYAISIMGDYFHGRPIIDKIKIVTEKDKYWQQVPNGLCASLGNDLHSHAYEKAHHALFKALDIEGSGRCADFNACLWCEHYRGIADAEHAYRVMSYRDFVIADMEASIGESLNTGLQKEYVRLLRQRVDEVLADMEVINPGCCQLAEAFLKEHGIHPDWGLYSTTSVMR
ncbi:hypothetical protein F2P58_20740 [Vibrio fortis]|uniref:Uncharacterized protein n=1 Tax=Vibrio fortis TaxID=212667 RepID=A0A5N3QY34_9VIBR|nr:hypothetical protein [Vibrio fortis]KAB0287059.1 hypothetical protein F2P58_20740 [Vibrio fortis]